MKARLTVFVLLIVALISVAVVASAITIPSVKESGAPEPPEIPTMKCKNDGVTQTVTMSSPIDWIASIWNWEWFEMKFDNEEHTQASVSMEGHHAAQGWGIWVSSNYDEEGNVTWTGTGIYGEEGHPYAYDVTLPGGTNVKYGAHGNPVEITIDDYAGSSYFDNGKSRLTKYIYKGGTNCVDENNIIIYLYQLQESYADGSFIRTTYAMNGEPTYAFLMTKDKNEIVLYNWDPEEEEPAEIPESGLVLFEGESTVAWSGWDEGWDNRNIAVDLTAFNDVLKTLKSGQSISVEYQSQYNKPILLIKTEPWSVWGQIDPWNFDVQGGDGSAQYSYDLIAGAGVPFDEDHNFTWFGVYGGGEDITVTKVEILSAE